jgi:hypothetical protein
MKINQITSEGLGDWIKKKLDPNNTPGFAENYMDAKRFILNKLPKDKYGRLVLLANGMFMLGFTVAGMNKQFEEWIEDLFIEKYGQENALTINKTNRKLIEVLAREIIQDFVAFGNREDDEKIKFIKSNFGDSPDIFKLFGVSQIKNNNSDVYSRIDPQ